MKIEIYNGEPKESVLRLRLINEYGTIKLVAVDCDGEPVNRGYIAKISEDGIHLYTGVSDELGIATDGRCVAIDE